MIAQLYPIRKLSYTGGIPFSFGILFYTCSMLYDPKFQEDRVKIVLPRGYQSWAQFLVFGSDFSGLPTSKHHNGSISVILMAKMSLIVLF